jgi:hypothetical protein
VGVRSLLQESYLQLDRRVLGVFRVGLGCTLLYDLLRRFPDARLLWSSEGVLGAEALLRAPQAAHQFSLLFACSSATSVRLAFAGLGALFLLYTLGLFTRVVQLLALLGYASLNARNLFFEDGGTGTVVLLLTWTLLLPLADCFSIDALRRDAALPRIKDRVRRRAAAREPLVTLAALALLLQASAIYWLNAAHKTGVTWRGGEAVHLVLWQHRVNTSLAVWFAAHEPVWLSPVLTWLTRRTEFVLPVLLLWPTHGPVLRAAAFVLAILLHGGIALSLTLGPFSYAMICLVWLSVPGGALDYLRRFVPRAAGARLGRLRARAVRELRRRVPAAAGAAEPRREWPRLREAAIACILLIEGANVLASNRGIPKALRFREPGWLLAYKPYLRAYQNWSMFAPDAPRDDGTMVVDAVTESGRHIDPFTAAPPDFEQIRRGPAPHSIALSDYFVSIRLPRNARYRRDLSRYLQRYRVLGTNERLREAELWWVSYTPPARGHYEPGPLKKEKIWRVRL